MKYLEMLKGEKKPENTLPDLLPKLPKGTFDSNDSAMNRYISENFYDSEIQAAIRELDSREISIMDYPEATRHRAFMLEQKLTEARDQDDRSEFTKLLMEWKNCFH